MPRRQNTYVFLPFWEVIAGERNGRELQWELDTAAVSSVSLLVRKMGESTTSSCRCQ